MVLSFLLVPVGWVELFPFSRFPMFSAAPRSLVVTRAYDSHGTEIPLAMLGIEVVSLANDEPLLNVVPQRPLDSAYRFWEPNEFAPQIQTRIVSGGVLPPIRFAQELIGPIDLEGRATVGVVNFRAWLVWGDTVELQSP